MEPTWDDLGAVLSRVEAFWGHLGPSCGCLGSILGRLGSIYVGNCRHAKNIGKPKENKWFLPPRGSSGASCGTSWRPPRAAWGSLGSSRGYFGPAWSPLGPSRRSLGPSGASWCSLEPSGSRSWAVRELSRGCQGGQDQKIRRPVLEGERCEPVGSALENPLPGLRSSPEAF